MKVVVAFNNQPGGEAKACGLVVVAIGGNRIYAKGSPSFCIYFIEMFLVEVWFEINQYGYGFAGNIPTAYAYVYVFVFACIFYPRLL
jgi:hypothetical protein